MNRVSVILDEIVKRERTGSNDLLMTFNHTAPSPMASQADDDEIYGGRTRVALGRRLRLTREVIGISQTEAAKRLGIASNTYNMMENGKNFPSFETLHAIVDLYQIDMNWLLLGEPSGLRYDQADTLRKLYDIRQRTNP